MFAQPFNFFFFFFSSRSAAVRAVPLLKNDHRMEKRGGGVARVKRWYDGVMEWMSNCVSESG